MAPTEQTLNISSTSNDWRGLALSNFGLSPFVLDGVLFASVEGFIQGIKFREGDPQRDAAFASSGWPAKHLGEYRGSQRRALGWRMFALWVARASPPD